VPVLIVLLSFELCLALGPVLALTPEVHSHQLWPQPGLPYGKKLCKFLISRLRQSNYSGALRKITPMLFLLSQQLG